MDDHVVILSSGEPAIVEMEGDFLAYIPILCDGEESGHVIVAAGDENVALSHG